MKNIIKISLVLLLFNIFIFEIKIIKAQEVESVYQSRTSFAVSKKILPKTKLSFKPELRWDENFGLSEYHLNGLLKYKLFKFMSLEAGYRLIGNIREEKDTEYFDRYQLNALFQTRYNRFEPGFRLSYTNYSDDENETEKQFLRYRVSVSYDIEKCKLTPKAAFEIFHRLDDNLIFKHRYKIGLEYELTNKFFINTSYKFDYYMTKYKNRHVFDLGFKLKL